MALQLTRLKLPVLAAALCAGLVVLTSACSTAATDVPEQALASPEPAEPATSPPATAASPQAAATTTDGAPPPPEAAAPDGGTRRYVLSPDGSEARYRVTEQLARLSFPSDAVGATSAVTGTLVIGEDGTVVAEDSKFVIDLTTLASDSSRRDGFVQRETLQTAQFPTAELVPTAALGLPSPLPTSGEVTFQLVGDLTIHGVTRPTTWEVTAQVSGDEVTGSATTHFPFAEFGLTIPSVMSVLSIEDDIGLELDFHLVPED